MEKSDLENKMQVLAVRVRREYSAEHTKYDHWCCSVCALIQRAPNS